MITLKHDNDPYKNYVRLSWKNSELKDFSYRVFRRKISSTLNTNEVLEDFRPTCVSDIDNPEENISVLNIHPACGELVEFSDYVGAKRTIRESEILQKWLYEPSEEAPSGYGKGRITIYSMSIEEFNTDPIGKLYNTDKSPKYDVICLGFYNEFNYNNQLQELSTKSIDTIDKYREKGYGVMVGHDVISGIFGGNKGMGTLRWKFGIELGQWDTNNEAGFDFPFKVSYEGESIKIIKAGQLMLYPWTVGTTGDVFDIAPTHTTSQLIGGTRWMEFNPSRIIGEEYLDETQKHRANCYLSTHNNTAMIQAGNDLNITDTEKKLITNTIFYIKQITDKKKHIDHMGIDDERPLMPTITNHFLESDTYTATFDFRTEDVGVKVQYYVEGTDLETGEKTLSNIIDAEFVSGINTYKYSLKQIESDTPEARKYYDDWIPTKDKVITSGTLRKGYYSFRLVCIDNNLNVSDIREVIFFMPGLVVREKSPAVTKYPNAQRVNHRYRGPHESRKANDVIVQAMFNLRNIKEIVNELDQQKSVMLERPKSDYTHIQENNRVINEMHSKMVMERIKPIKKY